MFTTTWNLQSQKKGWTRLQCWTLIYLSIQMKRTAAQLHCNARKLKFPRRIWDNALFLKVRQYLECVNREEQTSGSLVLHWGSLFLIPKECVLFNHCNMTDLSQQLVGGLYHLSLSCSLVSSACVLDTDLTPWEESTGVDLWNKNCKALAIGNVHPPKKIFFKVINYWLRNKIKNIEARELSLRNLSYPGNHILILVYRYLDQKLERRKNIF